MTLEVANSGLTLQAFPVAGVLEAAGPSLDLNYLLGTLGSQITFTRASTATDGLYTDAAGSSYHSFALNAPRISTANGLLIEEQRVNSLKNSDAPVTQTTASLVPGTYTLWIIGTGSATSSAGTAAGTSFGTATAGVPNSFTLTGAGTVVITVTGSLTRFQLDNGSFATSYIPTTGTTATRAREAITMPVGSWFSHSNAGTLVVEAMLPSGPSSLRQYLAEIADQTNNNLWSLSRNVSLNTLQALYAVGGVVVMNSPLSSITPGTVFKAGFSVSAAGMLTAINGAASTGSGNAALAMVAATTLNIGQHGLGNGNTNGFMRRVRYWPRMLGQGELNQVTT